MDTLNRWSIALGGGVLTGMVLLGSYSALSADAQNESTGYAYDQLIPDHTDLDVSVQLATYDMAELNEFADLLMLTGVDMFIDCGGYQHPAHVCTVDADLPGALELVSASTPVMREDITLTVGEYTSKWKEVLQYAHTIVTDTGQGPQNVTDEGDRFTVSYVDRGSFSTDNTVWQFGLAAIPFAPLWLFVGAVAVIATVIAAATIRPRPEEQVEIVGVDYFEDKL